MTGRRFPIEPRLLVAVTSAALFHGGLLVGGSFRRTYDAYVHIFFADHYARAWFSSWEQRWYTGFTTMSYPPGSHQSVALVSKIVGLEWAFVIVQFLAVIALVVGVYRFARIWTGRRAAGNAALLAAVSSSVAEAVHTFGQLPTTFSLAFLLNGAPHAYRWIIRGRAQSFIVALACTAATTAGHHVTTLFGSVFFLGPVVVTALVDKVRTPCPGESAGGSEQVTPGTGRALAARRLRRVLPAAARTAVLTSSVVVALVVVVLPYWIWSSSDPITQIPIPHASRSDFLDDRNAGLVFWVVPWGALLLLLPVSLLRGFGSRAWPLAASVSLLTVLGTGGTTPIPRLLLGGAFEILTLDRFTFWATVGVLPMAGAVLRSLERGVISRVLAARIHAFASRVIQAVLVVAFIAMAVLAADLPSFRTFQPDRIDPDPLVEFLAKDQHDRWRYLTLGFGDQMAWLAANTTATSVDGNYHSARRLPELTTTPVERLEGAKFSGVPGIGSLQQFLAVPSKYHLKYVFSNDTFYDPLLAFSGWHRLERLRNGVVVWERADVPPLPTPLPEFQAPGWQRVLWGTVPMSVLAAAVSLLLVSHRRSGGPESLSRTSLFLRGADRRLQLAARLDLGEASVRRWKPGRSLATSVVRLEEGRRVPIRIVWALGVGSVVATCLVVSSGDRSPHPEAVVRAFYDHVDFGRLDRAHSYLDPVTRPDIEEFLLDRSVQDGIVDSYGKLERVEIDRVERAGSRATVHSTVRWTTALESYEDERVHELVDRGGQWYLVPEPAALRTPTDQFTRRTSVVYRSHGRRTASVATTSYADVIDRPEVVTIGARALMVEGRWVLVGEVENTDVDPADVTITGQLLDADGAVLAQYDASLHTQHVLLPGERTGFRIEFEGVAGALDVRDPTAGEFRPGARTPLVIEDHAVASFAVYTKAVVTSGGTDRSLVLQDVRVADGQAAGVVRNDGTEPATVPSVLVTIRDQDGEVVWVARRYLERAVRPQRSIAFELALPNLAGAAVTDLPGRTFDNGLVELARPRMASSELGRHGDFGVDLSVIAFSRSATS